MKPARTVLVGLIAGLLASGCGGAGNDGPSAPSSPGPSASPSATPSPSQPPLDPVPTMPAKPTVPGSLSTVSGTVVAGVEPNCLLLDKYLLVGGDRARLMAGAKVTVTGRARPDLMTTCQQGTPFQVETVRPG